MSHEIMSLHRDIHKIKKKYLFIYLFFFIYIFHDLFLK